VCGHRGRSFPRPFKKASLSLPRHHRSFTGIAIHTRNQTNDCLSPLEKGPSVRSRNTIEHIQTHDSSKRLWILPECVAVAGAWVVRVLHLSCISCVAKHHRIRRLRHFFRQPDQLAVEDAAASNRSLILNISTWHIYQGFK
jgi:hypothetical protein